tara:strand:- start:2738 stop:3085 length:348 start_codon:yes stop_codon:yes gene_type:complete
MTFNTLANRRYEMTDEIENNNAEVDAAMIAYLEVLRSRDGKVTVPEQFRGLNAEQIYSQLKGIEERVDEQFVEVKRFSDAHRALHQISDDIRDVADAVWELGKRKELENLNGDEK